MRINLAPTRVFPLRFGEQKVFMDADPIKLQQQALDAQTVANIERKPHYTIPLPDMLNEQGRPVHSLLFLDGPHTKGFDTAYPVGGDRNEVDTFIQRFALEALQPSGSRYRH